MPKLSVIEASGNESERGSQVTPTQVNLRMSDVQRIRDQTMPSFGDVNPLMIGTIVEGTMPCGIDIGNWIARHYGQRPLEPRREVTEKEFNSAFRAVVAESGAIGEAIVSAVAARLGVSPASVK